jgi:ergothioneine biosynthesis protein EgtB
VAPRTDDTTPRISSGDGPTGRPFRLHAAYEEARTFTDVLAAPLSPEDQTVQSMPEVSPTKWHRGHTSWFFETFLLSTQLAGYDLFHPAFGYIFNSYYESLGARHPRPERGHLSRPGVTEVAKYRAHVDDAMRVLLDTALPARLLDLVELGINHEQQHQELLLMDIKHVLSCNVLSPAYAPRPQAPQRTDGRTARQASPDGPSGGPATLGWIEHGGGPVEVGDAGEGFAFDNEGPRHVVHLVPFALADRLVTCAEWRAFVDDGGYSRPELWLSDGWAAVQQHGWRSPLYWEGSEGDGTVFTLWGPQPLEPGAPVAHVSYYEADAFARWSGARLPTESEWEAVAACSGTAAAATHALHPSPSCSGSTHLGLFGSVWQWTSSSYDAYPGFRPAAGAVGEYNGKFMVNQQVLRGSACVTPAGHARVTYRNFFPASARWAFSGVRLAKDL